MAIYNSILRLRRVASPVVRMYSTAAKLVPSSLGVLPPRIRKYVEQQIEICQPDNVHVCDGSEAENKQLLKTLQNAGMIKPLPKYENCWLARTDPADVARVESKTVICTSEQRETVPIPRDGVKGQLGIWMSPDEFNKQFNERFPGCMKGRTMYVIPFSMGPIGGPLSKIGIECTDSPYVVASMAVMTRIGQKVLDIVDENNFIRCLHSVGYPLPNSRPLVANWPCDPAKVLVAHVPAANEIASYGSGYGGNSLLGKKCFALRLGSILGKKEGWLAEHMLILGITNPKGEKKYIAAAFPSACGKTNLAMLVPSLPGYKVECVGDDIAWMRFDEEGRLRAINPEAGFFGVAPGTSMKTNPNAMKTIMKNTIFTNVAETSDGGFYWEGLEKESDPNVKITSWLGQENWTKESGKPSSHPNSRFCAPAVQCPMMDDDWESPRGVPIDAILFGGRRPEGVPLVYESFDWEHGVFIGSSMRSEATAAAEHKGKVVMHDPFAMRPFLGYNFGHYMAHWLSMDKPGRHMPKIFHVNWFRKDAAGKFMWPGFGENVRVLDWVCRRVDGEDSAEETAIGYVPKSDALNLDGLTEPVDMKGLMDIPKDFWMKEADAIETYMDQQVNDDMPAEIGNQINLLKERVRKL